jgi:hypothetical protein
MPIHDYGRLERSLSRGFSLDWISPRAVRILVTVALWGAVAVLACVVCWAAWVIHHPPPEPAPPPSLDFEVVAERFPDVRRGMGREEVEALLGAPTQTSTWDRELLEEKLEVEHATRGWREEMRWHLWVDPRDENRWVAVLYTSEEYSVYRTKARGVQLEKVRRGP